MHGVPADVAPQAHGDHQPLGEGGAEQEVDAGIGAAVQAGQQHQDGESRSWKGQWRRREVMTCGGKDVQAVEGHCAVLKGQESRARLRLYINYYYYQTDRQIDRYSR